MLLNESNGKYNQSAKTANKTASINTQFIKPQFIGFLTANSIGKKVILISSSLWRCGAA